MVASVVPWYHRALKGEGARFRHKSRNAPEVSHVAERAFCLAPTKSGARQRSGLSDELAIEDHQLHKLGWVAKVSESGSWSSHWSRGFEINPQTATVMVQ